MQRLVEVVEFICINVVVLLRTAAAIMCLSAAWAAVLSQHVEEEATPAGMAVQEAVLAAQVIVAGPLEVLLMVAWARMVAWAAVAWLHMA